MCTLQARAADPYHIKDDLAKYSSLASGPVVIPGLDLPPSPEVPRSPSPVSSPPKRPSDPADCLSDLAGEESEAMLRAKLLEALLRKKGISALKVRMLTSHNGESLLKF